MDRPQPGPWFGAQLGDQLIAAAPIDLQRLGRTSATVQCQHQMTSRSLPQGMVGHQRLELPQQFGVPTELELRLDAQLNRSQPALFERRALQIGDPLHHAAQGRSAPKP
jgi:hypothetical protein